jgi:energy-coupling factor transporter ATP-binding protein EcfA2
MQQQPHIIQEGSVQYQLGELKGNLIQYDFDKILIYLQAKGKLMFGINFKIHQEDLYMLFKLCCYFVKDEKRLNKLKINSRKGILLSGPVGCGKTSLMKLLPSFVPHQKTYQTIPTRNAVFSFNHIGYKTIEDYGNNGYYCFDDLGVEPTGRHFGKDCNVMGEILLSRYDLFMNSKLGKHDKTEPNSVLIIHQKPQTNNHQQKPILTHATTNLNAQELEDRYGNRVRSRMRQMFNLIGFDENARDKRG